MKKMTAILSLFALTHLLWASEPIIKHETCEISLSAQGEHSLSEDLDVMLKNILHEKGYSVKDEGIIHNGAKDITGIRPIPYRENGLWANVSGPIGCWVKKRMIFSDNYYCTYDVKLRRIEGVEDSDFITQKIFDLEWLNHSFENEASFREKLERALQKFPHCLVH